MQAMMNKVGLVAGAGKFPVLLAKEAVKNGHEVYVAGIKGIPQPELETVAAKVEYFPLGQVSAPLKFFRTAGVTEAALAGLIKHSSIFGGVLPDLRAAKILATLEDMRAETIFRALEKEFAKDGIALVSSSKFLGSMMAPAGVFTKAKPNDLQKRNIRLGWKVAKTLASADTGLTAVVCDMAVVALEALEGTDACIRRSGELLRQSGKGQTKSGIVVVKVARQKQDFRFDLPVIGKGTIESMKAAGAKVLAVEAKKTLVIDQAELTAMADEAGIVVAACEDPLQI